MIDENIEIHLDGELKYRKERGKWLQIYCMHRGSSIFHEIEWLDIEEWGKGYIRIQSVNSIIIPIKPFIELLQEFAREMEAEEK